MTQPAPDGKVTMLQEARAIAARVGRDGWRRELRHQIVRQPRLVGLATRYYTRLYYYLGELEGGTWNSTTWMGVPVLKFPSDLWLYSEIINEVKPDLIVETGTWQGGSALYFASLLDLQGHGEVVSIDVEHRWPLPQHQRVTFLQASSVGEEALSLVREKASAATRVLVILDSDHRAAHVSQELAAYADLVTSGSYLVVEDGTVNGHPTLPEWGPGPYEATQAFLATRDDFVVDRSCERYLITNNTRGYLRRR